MPPDRRVPVEAEVRLPPRRVDDGVGRQLGVPPEQLLPERRQRAHRDQREALGDVQLELAGVALIPLHLKFRGNYQGLEPSPGAGGAAAGGNSFAFSFSPPNETGIITAIPAPTAGPRRR